MKPGAVLLADPPQWLRNLRENGPHPKNLGTGKLEAPAA